MPRAKPASSGLCGAEYCHFCGYGSKWEKDKMDRSNLVKHMVRKHGTAADCVGTHFDPFAGWNNTWRVLDAAHPHLLVAIKKEGSGTDAVYCLDCHRMEQMEGSGTPLVRFATHECPTSRGPSKLKGTKIVKAAEPATGGAGVSAPAPATTRALVVPLDWIADRTEQDMEGYGMDELEKEFEAAKQAWKFQKMAEAARKELEALQAATPVSTGSTGEAFTRTLAELSDARGIGKWVREKHVALKKDYEESDGYDPEEPFTARDALLGIVGVAKNADRLVSAAEEEMIQVRREMNLMRLQMQEAQRKTLALSATVNEQAAKIHELEAPLRAQAAAAYAAQRAEIAQYLPDPTQQPPAESPA